MKIIVLIFFCCFLSGCAPAYLEILDVLFSDEPAKTPVCDSSIVGISYQGKVCLKFGDDKYEWVEGIR